MPKSDFALPSLTWDGYFWSGEMVLSAWSGFQTRRGAYGAVSAPEPSDGRCKLFVASPDDTEATRPTPEQEAAFAYLLEHQEAIRDAALPELFQERLHAMEEFSDEAQREEYGIPTIHHLEELTSCLGLSTVHLLAVHKEGVGYVGLEFGCDWDEEHGAGVLFHRDVLIDSGQADVSFTTPWEARQDFEQPESQPVKPVADGQQTLFFELE